MPPLSSCVTDTYVTRPRDWHFGPLRGYNARQVRSQCLARDRRRWHDRESGHSQHCRLARPPGRSSLRRAAAPLHFWALPCFCSRLTPPINIQSHFQCPWFRRKSDARSGCGTVLPFVPRANPSPPHLILRRAVHVIHVDLVARQDGTVRTNCRQLLNMNRHGPSGSITFLSRSRRSSQLFCRLPGSSWAGVRVTPSPASVRSSRAVVHHQPAAEARSQGIVTIRNLIAIASQDSQRLRPGTAMAAQRKEAPP
jgi:hypothetical protein